MIFGQALHQSTDEFTHGSRGVIMMTCKKILVGLGGCRKNNDYERFFGWVGAAKNNDYI